jgi:hypothetical protein
VVETEGFNIVKEQVPNLEHSDLKRRVLQEEELVGEAPLQCNLFMVRRRG